MGPPAGSRPKGKEKEQPKIKNLRRYRIEKDFGTSSRQPAKRKREGDAENQKFEALYNRKGLWDLQPAAGQKTKERK